MTDGAHRSIPTFEEMTWPEIDAAMKAGAPIMLSTGATEQHGLHLPLNNDWRLAEYLATA